VNDRQEKHWDGKTEAEEEEKESPVVLGGLGGC